MENKELLEERYQRLNEADTRGDDDMSLGEAYEVLMSDYQEARALNDELMKLLELT